MSDFASFLDVPNKLATPQMLAQLTNDKILEFVPTFRSCLLAGYQLELVYFTTMRATDRLQDRANGWAENPLTLQIGGDDIQVPHSARIVDGRAPD